MYELPDAAKPPMKRLQRGEGPKATHTSLPRPSGKQALTPDAKADLSPAANPIVQPSPSGNNRGSLSAVADSEPPCSPPPLPSPLRNLQRSCPRRSSPFPPSRPGACPSGTCASRGMLLPPPSLPIKALRGSCSAAWKITICVKAVGGKGGLSFGPLGEQADGSPIPPNTRNRIDLEEEK